MLNREAGETEFPEEELNHLDGHKGSKPVRCAVSSLPCDFRDVESELEELGTERSTTFSWFVFCCPSWRFLWLIVRS